MIQCLLDGKTSELKTVGRDRDITSLLRTQRAATVGRLLLGEFDNWEEFLKPETTDFDHYSRRDLKANRSIFRRGISKEVNKFCRNNFDGMTEERLERLFLKIKERRGLELPLGDFEDEFAALKERALSGAPRHCTVVISLWGLQTKYPEDMLSKDIIESIRHLRQSDSILSEHKNKDHQQLVERRDEIAVAIRTQEFASRTCLLSCFNLVEATLNGLAWDFAQDSDRISTLSERQKKLIEDGAFRDKLIKYPEIITGRYLWDDDDERVRGFLDHVKLYRDSLVHASPFSRPSKFGGLDKLEYIYRIDNTKAYDAASRTARLLHDLLVHVRGDAGSVPGWLASLSEDTAQGLGVA